MYIKTFLLGLSVLALAACDNNNQSADTAQSSASPPVQAVDIESEVAVAGSNTGDTFSNWLTHGRTPAEQRFSPLDKINAENVNRLGLDWYFDFDTDRGQEATPIVVDGVIYVSSAWSKVFAVDALTGKLLWKYDPEVPREWGARTCCDAVNRGVAVSEGKVYVGTLDGRLVSLDAASGKLNWEVLTIDPKWRYAITGAPRVVKGKVLIGNGGAEFGVRGYVSAYDAATGEQLWRFYTVPGDPSKGFENPILEKAAETWTGRWWELGGGGTVWDSMAYDPELDLLYIGVGNGSPWDRNLRSPEGGDNWFLSSIVALKPDTGAYVWHYQTTPGENWDYTATQHMILAELEIKGQNRKVLMQAPKNGFFYVLDRASGELLSAEPFVPVNWATHVDLETGRPVEHPEARYSLDGKPWLSMPGPLGAHNWHPMSFSTDTGLVYIPAQEIPFPYISDGNRSPSAIAINLGVDLNAAGMPQQREVKQKIMQTLKGRLLAWDPVAQKEIWRVEHAGPWNGGVLSTAGNLVFQGTAAGDFVAYRADNGDKLWSLPVQTGVVAPAVSYAMADEQYISLVVGWGGAMPLVAGEVAHRSGKQRNVSRLLTFKLGGKAVLPEQSYQEAALPTVEAVPVPEAVLLAGKEKFQRYCSACHGDVAVSGGVIPDLRYSAMIATKEPFKAVVLDGVLKDKGMISFAEELSVDDVEAIRAYVIKRNVESHRAP